MSNYSQSDLVSHQIKGIQYQTERNQIEYVRNCILSDKKLEDILTHPEKIDEFANISQDGEQPSRKVLTRVPFIDIVKNIKSSTYKFLVCINPQGIPVLSKLVSYPEDAREKTKLHLEKSILTKMSYEENLNAPCMQCGKYIVHIEKFD